MDTGAQDTIEEVWSNIKSVLQDTAMKVLGKKKAGKSKEWISDDTLQLAAETRQLKATRRNSAENRRYYNHLCHKIRKSATTDYGNFITQICHNIEVDYKQNKSRMSTGVYSK